jgi:hypothetical protein
MSDNLAALIERLEKATGPDRDLDTAIHEGAIGLRMYESVHRYGDGTVVLRYYPGPPEPTYHVLPRYTASIDAALTLVPEHYSYELVQSAVEPPAFARARLWDWRRSPVFSDPENEWKSEGSRPLAIAICIAALRARSLVSNNSKPE